MAVIEVKELLEAGVHFGHQTSKWNPKMKPYIFGDKNGIYIINLQKTAEQITQAYNFVKDKVANGGDVIFVGTKKQAQEVVETEAKRAELPYVNERWLGGMLTNFQTIKKRVSRLEEIEAIVIDGSIELRPKKERITLRKELDRLKKYLEGIRSMNKVPQVMFVVDPNKEDIAIKEAKKLGMDVIGIVDTNCDPTVVDYCIPANDDAIKSIKVIVEKITEAVLKGKQEYIEKTPIKEEEPDVGNDPVSSEKPNVGNGHAHSKKPAEKKEEKSKTEQTPVEKKEEKPKDEKIKPAANKKS